MIEERIYILEDGTEQVIIERINYNGIAYMLLKNNKKDEVKIGFEYELISKFLLCNKLLYIDSNDEDFEMVSSLLLKKITDKLNNIIKEG